MLGAHDLHSFFERRYSTYTRRQLTNEHFRPVLSRYGTNYVLTLNASTLKNTSTCITRQSTFTQTDFRGAPY